MRWQLLGICLSFLFIRPVTAQESAAFVQTIGTSLNEAAKLTASDGATADFFGKSVSISGNRAIIGATMDDDNGSASGSAYIFEQVNGIWHETAKLTASDAAEGDQFGTAVSLWGNRALVGASLEDENGTNTGAAYVFDLVNGIWTETQKLTAADGAAADLFGNAVSLSNDRALIGAWLDDNKGFNAGAAYIFDLVDGTWTETQKLTAADGTEDDQFGFSVSLSGDRALIGAQISDKRGAAYIFDLSGELWNEAQKLTAPEADASTQFSFSVSLSGNRALIGSPSNDDNILTPGAAFIFDLIDNAWTETQKLSASDGSIGDGFGYSVSLSEDKALAGAVSGVQDDGLESGAAYSFDLLNEAWTETEKLTVSDAAEDDNFGFSVSLSGDQAVIGALLGSNDSILDSGSAFVFSFASSNDPRTSRYWKHELDIAASGGVSVEDFDFIIAEINSRFTIPHFNELYTDITDIAGWQDIFSNRPGGVTQRATAELGALLMNVMSQKISQFEVVTADGFTTADVITAAAARLEDSDSSNDGSAKSWGEQVNRGQIIEAGQISAGNIIYGKNDGFSSIKQDFIEQYTPKALELVGNYPNPFNPQTTIRFSVIESANVTLSVYDTLGRVVATLVNGVHDAGIHEVSFDAAELPSGLYFYQLHSPAGSTTKKMLLLK